MSTTPKQIEKLIEQLSQLPGIGVKTAERLAFFIVEQPQQFKLELAGILTGLDAAIKRCDECYNFSEQSPCPICTDDKRNKNLLCVVAKPQDIAALEKTNSFDGRYFVLGGTLDPLEGRTPESIRVKEMLSRIKTNATTEVILALNPDIPGETTMLYLTKTLKTANIQTSRLARGLPIGSDLEYADEVTLSSALKRREQL